jgi:4'-phosphopantetheinyl transferase
VDGHEALEPSAVHVWRVALDEALVDRGMRVLSPRERERALRFWAPELQRNFIAARAGLRFLLSRYLGEPPSTLTFSYGLQGKPALAKTPDVSFSLSHTQTLALVAIGCDGDVGIDIETLVPIDDAEALARRFFSPTEIGAIEAMDPTHRPSAFLGGWVRKEAVLKAHGAGLSRPLHEFVVPIEAAPGPRIVRLDEGPSGGGNTVWQVWDIPVGACHVAALAASTAVRRVSLREFSTGGPWT